MTPIVWAQDRDSPATTPSVGYLTLKISSTGQTIRVQPTSAASPHIVTVGDVFDAMEEATRTSEHVASRGSHPKRRRSPRQIGARISTMLHSLHLGRRTSDDPAAGPNW
ncbi:hypothetical protein DXG03_005862 [Asterophora parasitica]|uniref:DUF6699 domain-containing protein n=1 Tax=Asterophora parasitica TaxID=117018 RepID=A0A9P7K9J0_9AGAR|nr:hypothetical protein DXG03_005862 [Asterophora parasitica]